MLIFFSKRLIMKKNIYHYYPFKIFPCFWLGKTTCLIHHNKRMNCHIEPMIICHIEPLTEETWRRGWVVLVVWTKFLNKIAELSGGHCTRFTAKYWLKHSKNSEKSTWRTTSAIWSIFADLSRPLSAKFPKKDALSMRT